MFASPWVKLRFVCRSEARSSAVSWITPPCILTFLQLLWVIRGLDGGRKYFVIWSHLGMLVPSVSDKLKDKWGFWTTFTVMCVTPPSWSHFISHTIVVKPPKFPSFWGWSSPGVLLVSHPHGFLGHKRAQSLEAASHRLMLACKCGSGGWKLMPSSLFRALKTKTSSGSRGMNEALWRETEPLVQNCIFTIKEAWQWQW